MVSPRREDIVMTREEFNEMYWTAQPPPVRELRNMQWGADRTVVALDLAQKGYAIDVMIGVYGFEPWGTMSGRTLEGYKWAPALLQDYTVVKYPLNPWELGPNAPMPKGAIKTSLDGKDYPAFDPPKADPNALPTITNPVGAQVTGATYCGNFGDNWAVGSEYTDERGRFVKKSLQTPFGPKTWWEKVG
jgi:hypothetical protein